MAASHSGSSAVPTGSTQLVRLLRKHRAVQDPAILCLVEDRLLTDDGDDDIDMTELESALADLHAALSAPTATREEMRNETKTETRGSLRAARGSREDLTRRAKPLVRVAVAVGFEPTVELPPHTLSRRAP